MRHHAVLPIALLAALPCFPRALGAQNAPVVLGVDVMEAPTVWTGEGQASRRVQIAGQMCLWGDSTCFPSAGSPRPQAYVGYRVNDGPWVRYTQSFTVPPRVRRCASR